MDRDSASSACRRSATEFLQKTIEITVGIAEGDASAEIYTKILGMTEAPWTFPPPEQVGHISADPKLVAPRGGDARLVYDELAGPSPCWRMTPRRS